MIPLGLATLGFLCLAEALRRILRRKDRREATARLERLAARDLTRWQAKVKNRPSRLTA